MNKKGYNFGPRDLVSRGMTVGHIGRCMKGRVKVRQGGKRPDWGIWEAKDFAL